MFSLSALTCQVDALRRKYVHELCVFRAGTVADEYCDLWARLVSGNHLPPDPFRLLNEMTRRGFRRGAFAAAAGYLELCRTRRHLPHPNNILRSLFPRAALRGLIPHSPQPVAY